MKKIFVPLAVFLLSGFAGISIVHAQSVNPQEISSVLFQSVNAERVAMGLPALSYNSELASAAQKKAEDLLAKSYFDHTSPTGKQFYDWILEEGYNYSIAGENLAWNSGTINTGAIMSGWMNSPGHKENILRKEFAEAGVGAVIGPYNGKLTLFVAEEFGAPKKAIQASVASTTTAPTVRPIVVPLTPPVQEPVQSPVATTSIRVASAPKLVAKKAQAEKVAKKEIVATSSVLKVGKNLLVSGLAAEVSAPSSTTTPLTPSPGAKVPELVAASHTTVWTTLVNTVLQLIHAIFR